MSGGGVSLSFAKLPHQRGRAIFASDPDFPAEALGLSGETVRSCWRSIYQRLASEIPQFASTAAPDSGVTRGSEKRRIAIEYLRQNLHELRPVEIQRPGSATHPARGD